MCDLNRKIYQTEERKDPFGQDFDINDYQAVSAPHNYIEDLKALPETDKTRMIQAGIDTEEAKSSGTFIQKDTSIIHAHSLQEGLEIKPIKEALEQYDWLKEYYWKLMPINTDSFTAKAHTDLHNGYVIRTLPGHKVILPVQACIYMEKEGLNQNVHNIIIAEEGSELHIISGCATSSHMRKGLHIGVSEFYIKKKAKVSFTMIHSWAEEMIVRPRSVAMVEEDGLFINNYICLKPVKSLQMNPTTLLAGKGAVARFNNLLIAGPGSKMDIGGRIFLKKENTRAEIISRAITNGGNIIARGALVGEVPGVKAHLECRGLILNGGSMHAIPELEGRADGVEMSHEAAVGKIAQEEILYLMSRGMSEEEAISTIVRGFLNVDIPELPSQLKAEIDKAVGLSD